MTERACFPQPRVVVVDKLYHALNIQTVVKNDPRHGGGQNKRELFNNTNRPQLPHPLPNK